MIKRRLLAMVLSATMCLSLTPSWVYAETVTETEVSEETKDETDQDSGEVTSEEEMDQDPVEVTPEAEEDSVSEDVIQETETEIEEDGFNDSTNQEPKEEEELEVVEEEAVEEVQLAGEIIASGDAGPWNTSKHCNTYELRKDDSGGYILTFRGTGTIEDDKLPSEFLPYVTEVQIEDGIEGIGEACFSGFSSLETITIPDSVYELGYLAFNDCTSLRSVTLSKKIKVLEKYTFRNCSSLVSIYLGESLESIGASAFLNCSSLMNITLPSTVKSIKKEAFRDCSGLKAITIPENTTKLEESIFLDCISLKTCALPSGIITIPDNMFRGCVRLESCTIPDSVLEIGRFAFSNCDSITSITVPDGVNTIGSDAFTDCDQLTTINLGKSILNIQYNTFKNCRSLTNVIIPACVETIGKNAFTDCTSLVSVALPSNLVSMGNQVFAGCSSLKKLVIPDNVTDIPEEAFKDSGLTEITFEGAISTIHQYAFTDCTNLKNIVLPDSLSKLWYGAFKNCKALKSITIPGTVEEVCNFAFEGCSSLETVIVQENCKEIGSDVFKGCKNLKKVYLPDSLTRIYGFDKGNYVVYCSAGSVAESWAKRESHLVCTNYGSCGEHASYEILEDKYTMTLTISGTGAMAHYTTDDLPPWHACADQVKSIIVEDGIELITTNAFRDMHTVKEVNIADSVTEISNNAFYGCESISSLNLPDSITSMYSGAFENCTNLAAVKLPASLKAVTGNLFKNCSSLTEITIPASVKRIYMGAFSGCTSLKEIYIPASVTTIDADAFEGIEENVFIYGEGNSFAETFAASKNIPFSVKYEGSWGTDISYKISGTTTEGYNLHIMGKGSMTAGDGISASAPWTSHGQYIKEVVIDSGIIDIPESAFAGCVNLEKVEVPASVVTIDEEAFKDCDAVVIFGENNSYVQSFLYENGGSFSSSCGEDVTYTASGSRNGGIVMDISGNGPMEEVRIISEKGYPFYLYTDSLQRVTIESGVTSINTAFTNCVNLSRIDIPSTVTDISGYSFTNCRNLTIYTEAGTYAYDYAQKYNIPLVTPLSGACGSSANYELIGSKAEGYTLQITGSGLIKASKGNIYPWSQYAEYIHTIDVCGGITSIDAYTFAGCKNLERVNICESVTMIHVLAFYNCSAPVIYGTEGSASQAFAERKGYPFSINFSDACGDSAYFELTGTREEGYDLYIYGSGTMSFDNEMEYGYNAPWFDYRENIKSITIAKGITSIADNAFQGCINLTSVSVPTTVTSIGSYAFYNCRNLTEIALYGNNVSIGEDAFDGCYDLTIYGTTGSTVESYATTNNFPFSILIYGNWGTGENDFRITGTEAAGYTLSITGSGRMTDFSTATAPWFNYRSGIKNIIIDNGITSIGNYAFYSFSDLETITVPDSVKTIGKYAFNSCGNLKSIHIPDGVTAIYENTFVNCSSLETVSLPDSVTSIKTMAFRGCSSLIRVDIPDSVTTIGSGAFTGCSNFTIYGYEGSTAETYANSTSHPFVKIIRLRITSQPENINVAADASASFKVTAEDAQSYQWQYSADGTNWINSSETGNKTDTLTFTVTSENAAYSYRCQVTGLDGSVQESTAAVIYLIPGAEIIRQPENQKASSMEGTVSFHLSANNTDSFQWQYSTDGSSWTNCESESAVTKTLTVEVTEENAAKIYRCAVKGLDQKIVHTVSVSFELPAAVITKEPETVEVSAQDTSVTFTIEAKNASAYQWQYSTDGVNWTNSSEESGATAALTVSVNNENAGKYYRCMVTGLDGDQVFSESVNFILPSAVITKEPETVVVSAQDTSVTFTIEAENASAYQWQYSTDGVNWTNSSEESGATAALTVSVNNENAGKYYCCMVTGLDGDQVFSESVNFILPSAVITKQITGTVNSTHVEFDITVEAENVVSYQWQKLNENMSWENMDCKGSTTNTVTIGAEWSNCTSYRCCLVGLDGKTVMSSILAIEGCGGTTGDQLEYQLIGSNKLGFIITISGNGAMDEEYSTVEGPWSSEMDYIKTVIINEGVTSIGNQAFRDADELEYVQIPDSLTEIGDAAFYGCSALKEITIPWSVTDIGSSTFYNSGVTISGYVGSYADEYASANGISFNILDSLIITKQPESISAGLKWKISYSVEALGAECYQWQYSKDGKKWYNSSSASAKTDTIQITVSASNVSNIYRCLITAADGTKLISETAGIAYLIPGAKITKQPETQIVSETGGTVSFSVEVENASYNQEFYNYQWFYKVEGGSTWIKSTATGCTGSSLNVKVSGTNLTRKYRCQIKGLDGNPVTTNEVGMILVSQQPKDSTVSTGQYANFSVNANNIESYQWQFSKNGASWYTSTATGNTTNEISLKLTTANYGNMYRCKLTTTSGTVGYTNAVSFSGGMIIKKEPVSVSASSGDPVSFSVLAENASSYQWYYSKDGSTWYKSGASGSTSPTMKITVNNSNKTNMYRCKLTDKYGYVYTTKSVSIICE